MGRSGIALENIAGNEMGKAYVGGNVEAIDVFQDNGATIVGSIRTHGINPAAPDYEGNLIRAIRSDVRSLKGIENTDLKGTTAQGSPIRASCGTGFCKIHPRRRA